MVAGNLEAKNKKAPIFGSLTPLDSKKETLFIHFLTRFSLGRYGGATALGGLEIHHGFQ